MFKILNIIIALISFQTDFFLKNLQATTQKEITKSRLEQSPDQHQLELILSEFEAYIQKAKDEWNAPGLAVAVVKGGKIIYAKGFGTRIYGKDLPVNEHTVFQIASLSKNFLAHLIARLVQDKKLSFDDPIVKYIPDFKIGNDDITKNFTIRDALSHRSGLPHFSGDSLWYLGVSQEEMIKGLGKIPLKALPRKLYGYQNQIFALTSLIAEKVTGKDIQTLYQDYFFSPLGMKTASASLNAIAPQGFSLQSVLYPFQDHNSASPHDIHKGLPHPLPFSPMTYLFAGSTGVNLSVMDFAKWMIMLLSKGKSEAQEILKEEFHQILRSPHIACEFSSDETLFPSDRFSNTHYGMGFFISQYGQGENKIPILSHMGGFLGVRSVFMLAPTHDLGIVILSNLGSLRVSLLPEALLFRFMDLYLGLDDIDWSQRILKHQRWIHRENAKYKTLEKAQNPMPSDRLDLYTGTYTNDLYGTCEVRSEKDRLVLKYKDRAIELEHFNGNQFKFDGHFLSPAYCETDIGYVYFGKLDQNKKKYSIMTIPSLLYEGKEEGYFIRNPPSN